ncbi:hypothetical protein ACFQX6_67045 [Streptosporangium lutulentum]
MRFPSWDMVTGRAALHDGRSPLPSAAYLEGIALAKDLYAQRLDGPAIVAHIRDLPMETLLGASNYAEIRWDAQPTPDTPEWPREVRRWRHIGDQIRMHAGILAEPEIDLQALYGDNPGPNIHPYESELDVELQRTWHALHGCEPANCDLGDLDDDRADALRYALDVDTHLGQLGIATGSHAVVWHAETRDLAVQWQPAPGELPWNLTVAANSANLQVFRGDFWIVNVFIGGPDTVPAAHAAQAFHTALLDRAGLVAVGAALPEATAAPLDEPAPAGPSAHEQVEQIRARLAALPAEALPSRRPAGAQTPAESEHDFAERLSRVRDRLTLVAESPYLAPTPGGHLLVIGDDTRRIVTAFAGLGVVPEVLLKDRSEQEIAEIAARLEAHVRDGDGQPFPWASADNPDHATWTSERGLTVRDDIVHLIAGYDRQHDRDSLALTRDNERIWDVHHAQQGRPRGKIRRENIQRGDRLRIIRSRQRDWNSDAREGIVDDVRQLGAQGTEVDLIDENGTSTLTLTAEDGLVRLGDLWALPEAFTAQPHQRRPRSRCRTNLLYLPKRAPSSCRPASYHSSLPRHPRPRQFQQGPQRRSRRWPIATSLRRPTRPRAARARSRRR